MSAKERKQDTVAAGNFDFNIEKSPIVITGKNILQPWQVGHFAAECSGDFNPLTLRIVTNDGNTVASDAHVKFESIAPIRKGAIERNDCIFRN